ncbi:hypothetical protein DZS_48930 [Dickeya ananatis]
MPTLLANTANVPPEHHQYQSARGLLCRANGEVLLQLTHPLRQRAQAFVLHTVMIQFLFQCEQILGIGTERPLARAINGAML